MVLAIVIGVFVVFCIAMAIAGSTQSGQAQRKAILDERQAKADAAEAAKTLTGPGWSITVASRDRLSSTGRIAQTAVMLTNTGTQNTRFVVELIVGDSNGTRLGTISGHSDKLAPGETQGVVLIGDLAPLTTRKYGRLDYSATALPY